MPSPFGDPAVSDVAGPSPVISSGGKSPFGDPPAKRQDALPKGDYSLSALPHDLGQLGVGAISQLLGVPGDTAQWIAERLLAGTSWTNPKMGGAPLPKNPLTSENIGNRLFGNPQSQADVANREAGGEMLGAVRGGPGIEPVTGEGRTGADPISNLENRIKYVWQQATGRKTLDAAEEVKARALARAITNRENLTAEAATRKAIAEGMQKDLEAAGAKKDVAQALVMQHEQKHAAAEAAASDLEKAHQATPTTDPEQFGKNFRSALQKRFNALDQKRRKQAKVDEAIESAGNYERVNTRPVLQTIKDGLKAGWSKNPQLDAALDRVRGLLVNARGNGKVSPTLTVQQADVLKDTLMRMVREREAAPNERLDHKAIIALNKIRKQFIAVLRESWQPYDEAMIRYRALSPELNAMERNLGLSGLLERDPIEKNYIMSETEVAGKLIQRAKLGKANLTNLMAENPALRDRAAMYFARDLFGRDAPPTEASFATWVKNNRKVLEQFGLYNKFKSMQVAKATALEEVRATKGELSMAEELLKRAEGERAASENTANRATREAKEIDDALKSYRGLELDIQAARFSNKSQSVANPVQAFAKRMWNDGRISDDDYLGIRKDIDYLVRTYEDRKVLIGRLRKLGLAIIIASFSHEAFEHNWFAAKTLTGL